MCFPSLLIGVFSLHKEMKFPLDKSSDGKRCTREQTENRKYCPPKCKNLPLTIFNIHEAFDSFFEI